MDLRKANAECGSGNAELSDSLFVPRSAFRVPTLRPCASSASTFTVPSSLASLPRTHSSGSLRTAVRYRSYTSGRTITFTIPASSSSSTKMNPFAVSGRWRATTSPATSTHAPCSSRRSTSLCTTPAPRSLFNRAPHVARVHVGEPDLDPVPLGVASQDVERIEPHRLVVEEGAIILGGVIVPEPRRLVGEQAERGGVRLGEAELGERDHLREHALCGLLGDSARRRAIPELLPEPRHQLAAAPPAHGPPQRLRLAGGESRECLA